MPAATRTLRYVAFLLAFVAAGLLHALDGPAVTHAIVWLPSGVAVAGTWLLGLPAAAVVFAAVVAQRLWNDYLPAAAVTAGLGSAAEAVVGVLVLRACGCQAAFARLRDVLALLLTAAVAPLASVVTSTIFCTVVGVGPRASGYYGWWRMNALGVLAVVPLVLTWSAGGRPRLRPRPLLEGALLMAVISGMAWGVLTQLSANATSIVMLYGLVPLLLAVAWRFGLRGTTTASFLAAVTVTVASSHAIGPFQLASLRERHTAIQIFELMLLAVPLVFGSLFAERQANAQGWFRSEGLRAALLNVLPDVVYRMRRDGTVLDALVPEGVPLPTPRERLIDQPLEALVPADVADRMLRAIDDACTHGRSGAIEYPLSPPHHHRVREARFIRLADDEVLGIVRDVSERAAIERLLAWQARILELVATARPVQDVFTEIVRGIEGQMGRGMGSILLLQGRRLHLACAPSLPSGYSAAIEGIEIGPAVGTCGTAAHDNRTVITADIARDPAWDIAREAAASHGLRACWSVPIRSPAGRPVGTFAIYHREPRQPTAAQIELVERAAVLTGVVIEREQRESLLVSIQRHVAEGLFRCVHGHGLTYANQRFAELFGYDSPEEMLRLVATDADLPAAHLADLASLCTDRGQHEADEMQLHRRDGSRFWALVSSTLVRGLDGGGAYVGVVADITARKSLEEQLRQAQKMEAVGKLAGGVAHDFNNLLTAVVGYAEALDESLPSDDARRADTRGILDAASRAAGLTRQLLAFSRQQLLAPHVMDLAAIVDELAELLQRLIGASIELRQERPGGPVPVRVDRSQMEQVLLNLVVNARDAMPAGGTLTIGVANVPGTENSAPHALLWVRDTGTGMDETVRSHAFDPFFTTKGPGKGTGLGLSTVYGIARQSGGDAWLESEPGVGTTAWIRLPSTTGAAGAEPVAPAAPTPTAAATILLVEDEAPVRGLVQRALQRAGHTVLLASDGQSALAVARRHRGTIDLLITDVVMPGLGGRELAAALTAERPGLPVLFVSGFFGEAGDLGTGADGPLRLLEKPFAIGALLAAVNDLLQVDPRPT
ncbi:MAG: GAF domain-containing protein [Planctomycetes bacterium]|nr:GAF domain-containing protein [Planctomycetota bacterium]